MLQSGSNRKREREREREGSGCGLLWDIITEFFWRDRNPREASRYLSRPRFEPGTSQIQVSSVNSRISFVMCGVCILTEKAEFVF
jgi:hypothetical protein